MFRTRAANTKESRWTTKLPDGSSATSWADLLVQQPVLDDGRRSNSTKAPPGSPTTGDRYIVGYNASGAWSTLRGELVTWDGSTWAVPSSALVPGSIVYSQKRNEWLEYTKLVGALIAPALSPELLSTVSPAPGSPQFWFPFHLMDTLGNVMDQGRVNSKTADSATWTSEEYYRYIVPSGDTAFSSVAGYVATLITDQISHASYWVFHKPMEGSLVYVDDVNAFYYYNGTQWVLFDAGGAGGIYSNLFIAEGRQAQKLGAVTLTAAASNTYAKFSFPYSAIASTTVCPLAFFTAGGTDFTAPRAGYYSIGYTGFNITFTNTLLPVQTITIAIKINGATVHEVDIPGDQDAYVGMAFHGYWLLAQSDIVTFSWKCSGTNWNSEFTINSGPNFYVATADGSGGILVPHALGSHTDTTFGTPSVEDVVKWDGSKWVNGPVTATASPHLIISSSHSDTASAGALADGQVLRYNGGASKWRNEKLALSDLSNVTLTSPSSGQLLQYNGTAWVNVTPSAANPTLDALANVNTVGKTTLNTVVWNGSQWVPYTYRLDDLTDVNAPSPSSGQALIWNGSQWVAGNPSATVAFAGGCYEWNGSTWVAYTSVQVNCSTSGISFVAGVNGYWELIVTVNPGSNQGPYSYQWRVNGSVVGSAFGPTSNVGIVGNGLNMPLQTFSIIVGLGAGSSVDLISSGATLVKATFKKVGN